MRFMRCNSSGGRYSGRAVLGRRKLFLNTLNAGKCIRRSYPTQLLTRETDPHVFVRKTHSFVVVRHEGHYCFLAVAAAIA
jgi:hypothetical protein